MGKRKKITAGILCAGAVAFLSMSMPAEAAELAEMQVKTKAADTRPDYVLYVNKALNCVTVKQQGEEGELIPVKAMVCSCGQEEGDTPEGTFRTSSYYMWRKMVDATYGRYAVRFNGSILFHSVPYLKPSPDTLEWEEYNKLGESASLGCVRLSVEDAKWIYDNCKRGTTVVVYSDAEEAGELGKPEGIKIDADSPYRMWDPTDVDDDNPWLMAEREYVPFDGTIDEFDYEAYADSYPDLKKAFGYDREALYEHYITCGMDEGRIAVSY